MKIKSFVAALLIGASLFSFVGCSNTVETSESVPSDSEIFEEPDPSKMLDLVNKDMYATNVVPIWEDPYEKNVQIGELELGGLYHVIGKRDDFYAIDVGDIGLGFVIGLDNLSEEEPAG